MKTTKAMTIERETRDLLIQDLIDSKTPKQAETDKQIAERVLSDVGKHTFAFIVADLAKRLLAADAKLQDALLEINKTGEYDFKNGTVMSFKECPWAKLNEPVGEIKRYSPYLDGRDDDLYPVMEEDSLGDWIRFSDFKKAMRARVPGINKKQLCEKFTEIVAVRLDVFEQRIDGVWPPNTDVGRWRNRYIGRRYDELPPFTVELNHFKNEVDQFVAMLMFAIDDVAAAPKPE